MQCFMYKSILEQFSNKYSLLAIQTIVEGKLTTLRLGESKCCINPYTDIYEKEPLNDCISRYK